jgi:hypothetical protein
MYCTFRESFIPLPSLDWCSDEHGRRRPTITTLSKLAGALGVEVKAFFA